MCLSAQDEIKRLHSLRLLDLLLLDRTSGSNIIWATDDYSDLSEEYGAQEEIKAESLMREPFKLMSRAEKARSSQSDRTKSHAEVFTPFWVVKKMNDYMESGWFERDNPFEEDRVVFPENKTWRDFVGQRRMELTCGEAPYLVSRYDVSSGENISMDKRVGILDRKLRVVNENAESEHEWLEWAFKAFESTYGYEFQGDNLLIARLNLLMTFEDYLSQKFGRKPTVKEYKRLFDIISWNIWQMDGLTGARPYSVTDEDAEQLQFSLLDDDLFNKTPSKPYKCLIYDWNNNKSLEYMRLNEGENEKMKFDFIIGNPPYQEEYSGTSSGKNSIYHYFMDGAYSVSSKVLLITPARFLFNAGSTPKAWNEKMLNDPHFRVVDYESVGSDVFPNQDIKGGVVISYRDTTKNFGTIGTFTTFPELNSFLKKVITSKFFESITSIVVTSFAYHFTKELYFQHPELYGRLSKGHDYDLKSNVFEKLPEIFTETLPDSIYPYIRVLGRYGKDRVYRFIKRDYINNVSNLDAYKIFVAKANGSGSYGEVLSDLILAVPGVGSTESFLSIGCFDDINQITNLAKYIKTKFVRALLGVLKITQDITPEKWKYVPLQNFTPSSDIDWSQSISDIDKQLYEKYGLDDKEIEFIETHVKEMK